MKQSYKIDRLNLITYKHQKKKHLQSINSRYIAKSHIVNCLAVNQSFKYVNYRGSIITKVKFNNVFFMVVISGEHHLISVNSQY